MKMFNKVLLDGAIMKKSCEHEATGIAHDPADTGMKIEYHIHDDGVMIINKVIKKSNVSYGGTQRHDEQDMRLV